MESKKYFDMIAPLWETTRQDFFSVAVREQALDYAGVMAGQVALDVGAGAGFISRGLVARGLRVIAVDQSANMLAEIAEALPEADCRVGLDNSLPVADGAVDCVFANMYLHHVVDPEAAIREMVRTLKPGGILVITDLDEHNYEFLRTEQYDHWLGFRRDQIASWYQSAGLRQIDMQSLMENCSASSCTCGDQAKISIFLASGKKADPDS